MDIRGSITLIKILNWSISNSNPGLSKNIEEYELYIIDSQRLSDTIEDVIEGSPLSKEQKELIEICTSEYNSRPIV